MSFVAILFKIISEIMSRISRRLDKEEVKKKIVRVDKTDFVNSVSVIAIT
jgi:hypothetical protein